MNFLIKNTNTLAGEKWLHKLLGTFLFSLLRHLEIDFDIKFQDINKRVSLIYNIPVV